MTRNRNKFRRQSLTEVRVNGQDIRVSPYSGDAEHVRQMTELVCVKRPVPEIADQAIALYQGKRDPVAAAIREKLPSTNSQDPSLSINARSSNPLGDHVNNGGAPGNSLPNAASTAA